MQVFHHCQAINAKFVVPKITVSLKDLNSGFVHKSMINGQKILQEINNYLSG